MESEEQQAGRYIRNASVNVQVEFSLSFEGGTLFNLRATPWRNSSRPNRMILVADTSIARATLLLALAIEEGIWHPLDWRAKMDSVGTYEPEYHVPSSLAEKFRSLKGTEARSEGNLYEGPSDPDNVS